MCSRAGWMTWGYRHGLPLPRLGTFGAFPLDAGCGYLCPHGTWHSLLAIGQSYTEGLLILWRWENSNQRLKTSSSAFYSHEALGGLNGFNFFFFFLSRILHSSLCQFSDFRDDDTEGQKQSNDLPSARWLLSTGAKVWNEVLHFLAPSYFLSSLCLQTPSVIWFLFNFQIV